MACGREQQLRLHGIHTRHNARLHSSHGFILKVRTISISYGTNVGWKSFGLGKVGHALYKLQRGTTMPRIPPLQDDDANPESRTALDKTRAAHGRVTNMKRTLARSPVALHALMTWYDLRDEVVPFWASGHHALCPRHLGRHRLPGLLDILSPAADRCGRRPRGPAARRLGANDRRLRPATRCRPARCIR